MPEISPSQWLLVIPLLSGLAAFVLILVLTPFASKMRLLDFPDHRKRHREPTPMVGGIAIYLVLMAVLLVVSPPAKLAWMMASATVLVVIGFLDDVFDLGWRTRIAAQFGATCLMIFGSGLYIETLGFNVWGLDQLGWFGIGLTIFAVLCLTNGFNMLDGVDGLASGHVLVVIGSLAVVQLLNHGTLVQPLWLSVLAAVVFAFWLVNMSLTPLKKVFLGDAGSLLLGFVVCWLLVYYSQKPIAAVVPAAVVAAAALAVAARGTAAPGQRNAGKWAAALGCRRSFHGPAGAPPSSAGTTATTLAAARFTPPAVATPRAAAVSTRTRTGPVRALS